MDSAPALADRYGGPLVPRPVARVLTALCAVAFLALVVLVGLRIANPGVRAEVVAYDVLAPDLISVDFQLTMPPGTAASCRVQALNESRAQVGFVEVAVPEQAERQSVHQVEMATQGEAVSAEVVSCTAAR